MADSEKKSADNRTNLEKLIELQNSLLKIGYTGDVKAGTIKYQYVMLPTLKELIQPFFNKFNWVLLQPLYVLNEKNYLKTQILDAKTGEEVVSSDMLLVARNPENPQDWGKCITYFRRYSLLSCLGLVGDFDDDAFVTDEEYIQEINAAESVKELNELYKKLDKDRQKNLIKYFTARKEKLVSKEVEEKAEENDGVKPGMVDM